MCRRAATDLTLGSVAPSSARPAWWILGLTASGAGFLFTVRRPELPNWWDFETLEVLTRKISLGFLRLLNFALLAYLIALLRRRKPRLLAAEPVAALGRHPLPVFAASILSAMISLSFADSGETSAGRWVQTAFVITSMIATAAVLELRARRERLQR